MKQANLRYMFKYTSKLLYLLTTGLVLQLLKLRLIQKTQKRTLVTLNQQMQEMDWLLLSLVVLPKYI